MKQRTLFTCKQSTAISRRKRNRTHLWRTGWALQRATHYDRYSNARWGLRWRAHCKNRGAAARLPRGGLNRIYTVYIRHLWQGNDRLYGHIRCICTVLANPNTLSYPGSSFRSWHKARHCPTPHTHTHTHTHTHACACCNLRCLACLL